MQKADSNKVSILEKIAAIKNPVIEESFPFQCVITLFWNLALVSSTTIKSSVMMIALITIIINVLFIYSFITILRIKITSDKLKWINFNFYILLIVFIFGLGFLTILNSWFNVDGYVYYYYIRPLKAWDFKWNSLMMAGHMSQGYTIILMIGEFIFPNNAFGVKMMHCIMAIITIYSFYLIIRKVTNKVEKKYHVEIAVYTAIFSLSPMFLGMIGELNSDFPVLCFYVWMLAYGVYDKYVGESICGLLLCFSKETGCLLYGFYILGKVVFLLLQNRKNGIKQILKCIFRKEIIIFTFGGIVWIGNYLYNMFHGVAGWAQSVSVSSEGTGGKVMGYKINSIALFPDYIIQKCRQLLFLNFNWIMYALIVCAVFLIIWKGANKYKDYFRENGKILFGILFSFVAFLLYSFFYVTYNHYRYLLPFNFFVSFGTVIAANVLFRNKFLREILCIVLTCLLFVSCFYSIDPIAKQIFMKLSTGKNNIIISSTLHADTEDNVLIAQKRDVGYAWINTNGMYNFQAHHFGSCFDKTLSQLEYDEKTLIILPCEYGNAYETSISIFGVSMAGHTEYYWDTKKEVLNINCVDERQKMENHSRYCRLNYRIVGSINEISQKELSQYERVFYIALPFNKKFNHEKFLKGVKYKLIDSIQYISWKWDVYQIR